ncbi:MAG TPA: hypothetical protein VHL54_11425 [Actinomycetota bacterium]|nr:hypothetical protein [Actinomycetota bacterium]
MDDQEARTQLAEIAALPLDERADRIDGLIDRLESALEETSFPDSDSQD